MAKSLKKRAQRLGALVETLTRKVQALGRTAPKKVTKQRVKVASASAARKVKRDVVKHAALKPVAPMAPDESAPQSGVA